MRKQTAMVLGGVVAVLVITGVVLIAVSFSVLEPNEVGIRYNKNSYTLDTTQVYRGGRHFIGVGQTFIAFPLTAQQLKFSFENGNRPPIQARTMDGLAVLLEISMTYRLDTTIDALVSLYMEFGEYEEVDLAYDRITRNVVREVASQWNAFQYFDNRTLVESGMRDLLVTRLQAVHADVDSLQLLNIDLPDQFEAARTAQETALQAIATNQNALRVAIGAGKALVARAREEAQVLVLDAQAEGSAIISRTQALVSALETRITSQKLAYKRLQDELGLTNEQLLAYVWTDTTVNHETSDVSVNLEQPAATRLEFS